MPSQYCQRDSTWSLANFLFRVTFREMALHRESYFEPRQMPPFSCSIWDPTRDVAEFGQSS